VAARKLDAALSNTEITYRQFLLKNGILDGILADDSIYGADGITDHAAIVCPGRANFSLKIGQDITTWETQLQNMNKLMRVYEVLAPKIKRPTAICELTGLT
jgi:uncharacterized linocin/CFP29 family protein